MFRMRVCAVAGMLFTLVAGCPSSQPGKGLADPVDMDPGSGMDPGNDTDPGDGTDPVDNDETGLIVETVAGSATASLDVYDAATNARVLQAESTDELIELDPGEYTVTEYFNESFVIAPLVQVTAGQVTRVRLGAVTVSTVSGSEGVTYDIYDATGETLLDQVNDSDLIRAVPAGTYVLKEYFNDAFDIARDVVVTEGAVTTIPLGAVRLITVEGAETETYDIFDGTGQTLLDRVNDTE